MELATVGGGSATLPPAWGGSRPSALPSPTFDRPAGPLPERDLPLPIQRACTRVQFWRAGPFEAIGPRDRAVLAEVIRCVDRRRPQQAVYVRRDTLADREGCSVPTITRALARLASLGWIVRDQVKSRIRGFQVGSVELTSEAIAWLGLLEPSPTLRESPVIDASRSSSIQCIHRQPPAAGLVKKHSVKAKPGELPDALRWLEHTKVSRSGVFLLMGLARKRGVLLEAVVTLCREQILAARTPFAYIRDLLTLDKDWTRAAQTVLNSRAAEVEAQDREAKRCVRQERMAKAAGRWFLAPRKRQLLRVEGDIFMTYALGQDGQPSHTLGARPDVDVVLCAIDEGRLIAW